MRRLHALNEQRPGLKALAEWVERAKRDGAFKGPVHGPIGVEIALDDALSHARPVEHVREREREWEREPFFLRRVCVLLAACLTAARRRGAAWRGAGHPSGALCPADS